MDPFSHSAGWRDRNHECLPCHPAGTTTNVCSAWWSSTRVLVRDQTFSARNFQAISDEEKRKGRVKDLDFSHQ